MLKRAGLLLVFVAAVASAQPPARRATNIATLVAYPGFYHQRPVIVVGTVGLKNEHLMVSTDAGSIHVVTTGNAPEGVNEVRGEFWDLGRMKPDDPQLVGRDLRATFSIDPEGPWPRPGEATAIMATAIGPTSPPSTASIRAIVLDPERYRDQKVTVTGQFSGRNLLGELPDAPGRSRYDFVLRSADAALWVSNIQPKGKDLGGRDFQLGLDARIDTNRWVSVSGTVQQGRGLVWIEADAGSLILARPPVLSSADDPIRVAPAPPPEVVFSTPTDDESDVSAAVSVRIQFSRDLDQATFKDHVRVSYVDSTPGGGGPTTAITEFTTQYDPARSVLELRFARPFERFRTVKVELQEGILATDKQPLKSWVLMFETGGS